MSDAGADTRIADLIVVGSGASGLACAVTAAHLGLDVIVIEKDRHFGGTSAWSGGWMWIPRNPLAIAAGIVEDIDAPRTYLKAELGNGYDDALCSMFLEQAPRMVDFFMRNTELQFVDGNLIPDFHDKSPGARQGGRSVCAKPFDGRELGRRLTDLKPPLDEIAPFGMGIASGADLKHFLFATRSVASFRHVAKRVTRHMLERARHGRGLHLTNGNALVARLLKSADAKGVTLMAATPAQRLIIEGDRIVGIIAGAPGAEMTLRARRGIVLATGGFPHDLARKAAMFPHAPTGHEHHSAAPETNTGDGLRLGEAVGAIVRDDLSHAGAWAPVSLVPHRDGSIGRFPHLIERAKPGLCMVIANGERFANEADSYHDLMQALFRATTDRGLAPEAWMICDATFRRRYGLGRVRPRPFPIGRWIANGYLKTGRTWTELADACGIDASALKATIASYNEAAATGTDRAFGRGESPYNKIQGEAGSGPNPCLAPIVRAPFYAVKIVPGSLGTFAGLKTDAHARVLSSDGAAIPGLYAIGNDMASIMAGRYPAGGITLGPGMTFAYIAAHDAAAIPLEREF